MTLAGLARGLIYRAKDNQTRNDTDKKWKGVIGPKRDGEKNRKGRKKRRKKG